MARDIHGRFLPNLCPDQNCDGTLMLDRSYGDEIVWRCDGLTHEGDAGPLVACARSYPARSPSTADGGAK